MRIVGQGVASALFAAAATAALGQPIVPNGLGTTAGSAVGAWTISGGTKVGGNLFHSFSRFNVNNGGSAMFTGPGSVEHIIARVTGGERSSIDGRLGSDIAGANLWLMNPAGITFGANASLDVQGSFRASTGHYVQLGPSARFDAATPASSLVSAPPSAFGFLGPAASIAVNGATLETTGAGALGLAGGAVTLRDAFLYTSRGDVELSGTSIRASNSSIRSDTFGALRGGTLRVVAADELVLNGGYLYTSGWGDGGAGHILVSAQDVRVAGAEIRSDSYAAGTGGNVQVSAADALAARAGSFIGTITWGTGAGGDVSLSAGRMSLGNSSVNANGQSDGATGAISVDVASLLVRSGSNVGTHIFGNGGSGAVEIRASDSVRVTGFSSALGVPGSVTGTGGAGLLHVTTPSLVLSNYGSIESGSWDAAAGGIVLDVGSLTLKNSGQIESRAFGAADGGSITINASGRVSLRGYGSEIAGDAAGGGRGGDIRVSAPVLLIEQGSISSNSISSATGQGGSITLEVGTLTVQRYGNVATDTFGDGAAGSIVVHASESVSLQRHLHGTLTSNTAFGAGAGGTITVVAPRLVIDRRGGILASSIGGTGAGGSIVLDVGALEMNHNSFVAAFTTGSGAGGSIDVHASDSVSVIGHGARPGRTGFYANSEGCRTGCGQAGAVRIVTPFLALDNAVVTSSTFGDARAGSIEIQADQALIANRSAVATLAKRSGDAGRITVKGRRIDLRAGGFIGSSSDGRGFAGDISIEAADALTLEGSEITTGAARSDGGNIVVRAGRLVHLRDSIITTSVNTATGSGGNITIDPTFVILENSEIIARAAQGAGGNIRIVSDFFLSQAGLVDASSERGISGTVAISSPRVDLAGSLRVLPTNFLDASSLLRASCSSRAGQSNSFLAAGRGGLAEAPGGAGAQLTRAARTSNIGLACAD